MSTEFELMRVYEELHVAKQRIAELEEFVRKIPEHLSFSIHTGTDDSENRRWLLDGVKELLEKGK